MRALHLPGAGAREGRPRPTRHRNCDRTERVRCASVECGPLHRTLEGGAPQGTPKWQNTVTAAAAVAPRAHSVVYELYSTTDLVKLIEEVAGSEQSAAVFILHEQATERLSALARKLVEAEKLPEEIYLLVGPEGGISDREVQLFTDAGAQLALLGDEVPAFLHRRFCCYVHPERGAGSLVERRRWRLR